MFFCFLVIMSCNINASEMRYYDIGSNKELSAKLSQAIKNDFPVFIYIHADWCFVCDYMDKDVWSKKSVSDKFNKEFLNLSIDISEMTREKNDLLNFLKVQSTPAYFFYNSSGILKHRQGGFVPDYELFEIIDNVLENSK